MFSIDPIWFFIVYAIVIAIILITYFRKKRSHPGQSYSFARGLAFWVSGLILLVVFLACNAGVIGGMDPLGFTDETILIYGKVTSNAIDAAKNNYELNSDIDNQEIEAADFSALSTEEDNKISMELISMTDIPSEWVPVPPEGARAGAFLKKYPPTMMLDGDVTTSWQTAIDDPDAYNSSEGDKEWIGFGFHKDCKIDYIVIYNGTPESY
ncbi:MAG: hypothetical protein K6F93_01480, partial [Lachnospiraceae bacterium]|nr:hypothetical protein [Lachnospiraceae bacterium]